MDGARMDEWLVDLCPQYYTLLSIVQVNLRNSKLGDIIQNLFTHKNDCQLDCEFHKTTICWALIKTKTSNTNISTRISSEPVKIDIIMYVCMYICICVCVYVCVYVCMYVCIMYVCVYVHIHVYIHVLITIPSFEESNIEYWWIEIDKLEEIHFKCEGVLIFSSGTMQL